MDCRLFRWECFVISVRDLSFVSVGIFCRICLQIAIRFGRNVLSDLSVICHSFQSGDFVGFVGGARFVSVGIFCRGLTGFCVE